MEGVRQILRYPTPNTERIPNGWNFTWEWR